MAVNITATRTSTLFNDQDGDGVFDPGDVILTRIRITNSGTTDATGISVTDTLSGVTLVAGSVQVTPIAFDDFMPSITGNTPITFTAGQLLGNDIDPDGAEINLTITGVSNASHGSIVNNGNGTFTFTPTTGYVGSGINGASFEYTITDEQGLGSVTTGIVKFDVAGLVWYVDNTYGGENGASDGSYIKPFTNLGQLNDNGTGAAGTVGPNDAIIGDDDVDGAGDTIFVYHNGGNYTAGITLEAGQKLLGDGVGLFVNGHNVGGTERTGGVDNVATNAVIGQASGTVITLATDNTVRGVTLDATGATTVGLADGNGSVTSAAGTLTVNNVSFTGLGQAVDIDQGGNLAVTIDSLTSTGATGQGVQLAGTASSGTGLITGSVTVTAGSIAGAGTAVLVGVAGGGTANSGGNVNLTYGGTITGATGTSVEIQDRTGGTVTFSGNITHSTTASSGIVIDSLGSSTVNFNGQSTSITTTTGTAVNLTNNTGGTINFTPTGGGTGFDVAAGSGKGIVFTGGGTLAVTGTANSVATATGQILDLQNGTMGTSGIQFASLGATGIVAGGNAININNLDAAGAGTFQGGAVTIAGTTGAGVDGINLTSSNSTFTFASATIDNTTGDGIEINGQTQTQGAVTFTTVDLDTIGGVGVSIAGASNAVNINGGTIGATNDPAGDGVNVNGGTGAVTVAASVTKNGAGGNEVVDISGHSAGAIQFTGAIASSNGSAGIRLVNNTSGNIDFTGAVTLNTGTLNAIQFTNTAGTGANVTFTAGNLNVDTTSGTGLNATNSTIGAGSLTISGTGNSIAATTGRAINIDGVTSNVTLHDVAVTGGGTTTGVFLKNTGAGGQFIVTGDVGTSTQGSGGTIGAIGGADVGSPGGAATTGTGLYMENVSNVSLTNMIFGTTGSTMNNFGIRGENVTNFTLTDSEFRGNFGTNTAQDEDAIRFGTAGLTTGLKGTALFQGNNIGVGPGPANTGALEVGLSVYVYGNNTLNLTIKDTPGGDQAVFGANNASSGTDGFLLESGGTSNVTVTVTGVNFNGSRGDLMQIASLNNTVQNITITGNQFVNSQVTTLDGGAGVAITGSLTGGSVTYNIDGNTFKGTRGASIFSMFNGSSGTITGIVNNNTFGTANGINDVQANTQANYGSLFGGAFFGGIDSKFPGTGVLNYALRISNNTIRDSGSDGVIMLRSASQDQQGTARVEATISNNTIAEAGTNVAGGIYIQVAGSGAAAGDAGKIGLNISNNNINVSAAASSDAVYIDNGSSLTGLVYLPGYAGPSSPFTEVSTYLTGKGNVFDAGSKDSGTGGAVYNPGGTLNGSNFVLAVPALAANPNAGLGWQDLPDSPVTAPPRDPDLGSGTPDNSGGGSGGGDGGGPGGSGGGTGGGGGGGGGDPPPPAGNDHVLTLGELNSLVEAAIARWVDAGATPAQLEAMRAVQFGIVDMAGIYVGAATHGVINIDIDGAGYGWFVDSTPGEDSEFAGSGTSLHAAAGTAAAGKLDLLTVLMHELGHQIGLDDDYSTADADDLMYGYMNVGERRLPASGEAAGAVPGSIGSTAFALTPVSVGTLPSNKVVDVFFKATIDLQSDKFISALSNDSTISGSNFSNVVVHEGNALDSLTLGSTVFVDANLNGLFDAGEGRTSVALQLYADTNDSGGWDAGDVLLGSTTTGALGAYSFAGLAPGDYIVVVTAANFNNGQPLDDLLIVQGVAADPDNNVDNDNNGVAATGGAVASQTITLAYNTEPTAGTGNDTNNTLDFGFVANQPPVANDDAVSVAEDSGANDLTSQLLSNDTDPENDTKTITSATQGTHGTTSVVAGVLTYTPTGNYNGTDTFTYTIDDGNGHTDTATVNVTVTAANDPVTGSAPATASLNEDATNVAIAGMSISDVDATLAPAGVYEVTLSSTHGTMTLTTLTGLTFTGGSDGTGDTTMTFHGTLAAINTALATAKYTPDSNYNGSAQIDLQVTDTFGGIVATGTGVATNDTDSVAVTVNSVNDEPAGADQNSSATVGVTYTFTAADFSENFSDPNDSPANAFDAVKITTLPGAAAGEIRLNNVAIGAGAVITKTQIDNNELTFVPAAASGGTSPTFTFQVRDDGGILNGGVQFDQSPNTYTINIAIADVAPALDLDANDSNTVGTGFSSSYTEGGAAAAISDTDVSITDTDVGDDIVSATITITNAETGDKLNVGTLPATVTVDPSSTDTVVKLVAAPGTSAADFETAIEAVTYSSTSDDPTDHGTNSARSITVTVNDGALNSNTATATVTITDSNDAPTGTSSTITATEDAFRVLNAGDLGFNDVDGTLGSVTISAVTGGKIYFDADGAGGADPVEATLPHSYTAAELAAGKLSFKANQDLNGTGVGTITFTVTDDDGADASSSNTLTVDVTAVNDSPVLSTGGPIAATEQTAVAILTGAGVADVDLDARNGGNGDYAGASFSVNRNPATNAQDVFTLVAGPNFTIDGSDLKAGGQIFATISVDGSTGLIVINFTSLETTATSALVDEVIQSVRYTNSSDNPPASVDLSIGFDDGSPGGGQGAGATDLDINLVTVNITAVNDPPTVTAADTTVSGTEDTDLVFEAGNGNAITVADVDSASLTVTLTVANGSLTLSQTTGLSVTGDGTATVELAGSAADINAALEGLVYRGNLNYEGSDTLGIEVDDGTDTDTENVAITLADDGIIHGDSGDNTLYGTPQNDFFMVQQGGNDTVYGLASDDIFYFGGAFTGADAVDGDGGGKDVIVLQGNYTLTLSTTNITNVESISLKSGSVTNFGDTANNFYDYDITTVDANVAAAAQLIVNGSTLRAGEDFTFDGSGEHDGKFLVFGGHGVDTLIGGDGNDIFVFEGDRWGASDSVDGGLGRDSVVITAGNGTTHIDFGAASLLGIESISVANRYSSNPSATPDYEFVLDNGNVAAGQTLIVNGFTLTDPGQTISIDGSDIHNGKLILFGGAGNDVLIGGDGGDTLYGAGSGDTLTGGLGNDVFRYDNITDSNPVERDGIQDFTLGDLIDLSRIDANTTLGGDQAFDFIGGAAFSGTAGELRFENISAGGPIWVIQGDTDGINGADFEVVVVITDLNPITSGDFIL
jgi:hypothetical protein